MITTGYVHENHTTNITMITTGSIHDNHSLPYLLLSWQPPVVVVVFCFFFMIRILPVQLKEPLVLVNITNILVLLSTYFTDLPTAHCAVFHG